MGYIETGKMSQKSIALKINGLLDSKWQHKKFAESYHDMLENKGVTSMQGKPLKILSS
jgi:hypothetical protein